MELTNEFTVPVAVERAWEVLTDVELIAPCLPGAQLQEIEGDEYRGVVKVKVGPITAQYKGAAAFQEQDEAARRLVLKAEGRDTRGQGSASALITVNMQEQGGSTHVTVDTDLTIKGKVAQFGRGMIADVSAKLLTQFVECLERKLDVPAGSATTDEAPAAPAPTDAATAPDPDAARQQPGAADEAPAEEQAAAAALQGAGAAPGAGSDAAGTTTAGVPGTPGAAATAPSTAATSGVRKVSSPEPEAVDLVDAAGSELVKRLAPVAVVVLVLWLLGRRRSNKAAC